MCQCWCADVGVLVLEVMEVCQCCCEMCLMGHLEGVTIIAVCYSVPAIDSIPIRSYSRVPSDKPRYQSHYWPM